MTRNGNIDALIPKAAREAQIDPDLFARLIKKGERSYKGWQSSPAGAFGPAQLMPGTASALASKYHLDPNTYYGNLLAGAHYLREQLSTFKGNRRLAVAAYNAGPGNVQKYGDVPPFAETQNYVKNIFSGWKQGEQPSRHPVSETTTTRPRSGPAAAAASPPALEMPDFLSDAFSRIAQGGDPTKNFMRWMNKESEWTDWASKQRQQAAKPAAAAPGAGSQPLASPGPGKNAPKIAPNYSSLKLGKTIGTPHSGTHTIGNWQSDNAYDVAMPEGTPIRADFDGVISSRIGYLGDPKDTGRFAGQRVTVDGKGNSGYYAHLSRLAVKAGQRVKKGQIIGYSGSANGVEHLHVGYKNLP